MQFNDRQPIWLQIHTYVSREILTGRWPEQERCPAVRELAVTLQVNPNTVMRAYDKLEAEGVILSRRGLGFFVAEGARDRTREIQRNEFVRVELHGIFDRMNELGIDIDSIRRFYEMYLKKRAKADENEQ